MAVVQYPRWEALANHALLAPFTKRHCWRAGHALWDSSSVKLARALVSLLRLALTLPMLRIPQQLSAVQKGPSALRSSHVGHNLDLPLLLLGISVSFQIFSWQAIFSRLQCWEVLFFFDNSAPAVYNISSSP